MCTASCASSQFKERRGKGLRSFVFGRCGCELRVDLCVDDYFELGCSDVAHIEELLEVEDFVTNLDFHSLTLIRFDFNLIN